MGTNTNSRDHLSDNRRPRLHISTHLKPYEGKYTANYSKWWGRYARKYGGFGEQKVFHSFRHTAKDAFRDSEIPKEHYDALQGHTGTSEGDKYGRGFSLKVLKKAMDQLHYDVDLSHLKLV